MAGRYSLYVMCCISAITILRVSSKTRSLPQYGSICFSMLASLLCSLTRTRWFNWRLGTWSFLKSPTFERRKIWQLSQSKTFDSWYISQKPYCDMYFDLYEFLFVFVFTNVTIVLFILFIIVYLPTNQKKKKWSS